MKAGITPAVSRKGGYPNMCLRNLFGCEANCSWLLFIIVILLLIDNSDCGNDCYNGCNNGCYNDRNNGCGCGC